MSYVIHNPILTGMHPDPSICCVGEDFYLVNSTFEFYPAIPVYHSTDLIHWEQLGHVIERPSQLNLPKGAPNCIGIYAPTIRYYDGMFYCIVTNVGDKSHEHGNFFCKTTDPRKGWSDPIWTDLEGIDPSLYFEDGHMYYTGTDKYIYLCEIDPDTGARIGEKQYIWEGSGGNNPEGPHLYKINGTYYLMIAEGGTENGHMITIARSDKMTGPFESCPYNPVLTNRGTATPIKAVGHGDLVCDPRGDWWSVCLCNRPLGYPFTHNLGRETCLVPVEWKNGWPVMGEDTRVNEEMRVDREPLPNKLTGNAYAPCSDMEDDFTGRDWHMSWNTVYTGSAALIERTKDKVILHGNDVPVWEDDYKAMLVRRQEHFAFEMRVNMNVDLSNDDSEAGCGVYMNNRHHYEIVYGLHEGSPVIFFRRQLGTMTLVENVIPYAGDRLEFVVTADRDHYSFGFVNEQKEFVKIGEGECRKITTECGGCFTGNYLHIYATATDAKLTHFAYRALSETE